MAHNQPAFRVIPWLFVCLLRPDSSGYAPTASRAPGYGVIEFFRFATI
jgi:hypothetical protein